MQSTVITSTHELLSTDSNENLETTKVSQEK